MPAGKFARANLLPRPIPRGPSVYELLFRRGIDSLDRRSSLVAQGFSAESPWQLIAVVLRSSGIRVSSKNIKEIFRDF